MKKVAFIMLVLLMMLAIALPVFAKAKCPTDPAAEAAPDVNWSRCLLILPYLPGANLSGANLSYGSWYSANLSGANLSDANLFETDLFEANLSDANLHDAKLTGAGLYFSNLSGTDLSDANLSGADLLQANLSGADLSDANLSGVIWDNTTCPDGSNTESNGLGYCTP